MACDTITERIQNLVPDLAQNATQSQIDCFIEEASTIIPNVIKQNESNIYNWLIAYYVAHTLVMQERGGAAGPISSIKEGNLSTSFATEQKFDELGSTWLGKRFHFWLNRVLWYYRSRIRIS